MGAAVLVSDVIQEAMVRLALPTTLTTTTFPKAAEALALVKFSARRLGGIIRRADSDYFLATGSLSTTANQQHVALPSNFSDLRQLSWMRSADERVELKMASVDEMDAATQTPRAWDSAPKYRLQGGNILFFPEPSAVYTLSIYYDTGIYVTATSDSIDCQPGWEEWLVLDVCVRVRQMEEASAADIIAERNKVEYDIVRQATSRDRYRTHEVRDLWEGGEVIDSRSLFVRR
jgi:hypothetical protein